MTFGIRGGLTAGARFYNALKLIKRVVNLGDSKSLACHPASTTHRQMSPAEQIKAGVTPEMIRMSIGIEHIDDILADLDHALECAVADGVNGRQAVAARASRPVEQVTIA
jgi:O-acetylhomoserine (thiol)-lyase